MCLCQVQFAAGHTQSRRLPVVAIKLVSTVILGRITFRAIVMNEWTNAIKQRKWKIQSWMFIEPANAEIFQTLWKIRQHILEKWYFHIKETSTLEPLYIHSVINGGTVWKDCWKEVSFEWSHRRISSTDSKTRTCLQLFRERLSEKVHATIPKGIVGGFECTVP